MKGAKKGRHPSQKSRETETKNARSILFGGALLLIVLVSVTFSFSGHRFTNWDDDSYVVNNPVIRSVSPGSVFAMFSTYAMGNYHPVTMLSYAINYRMTGLNLAPFVITNILLHGITTVLLFLFANRLLREPAWAFLVAGLFAVHPMHVESVMWVSERKDVLYALFFLLSLMAYEIFVRTKSWKIYAFAIVAFLLSLLSKGMAVTLAPVLLLLDYLYGRGWKKEIWLEKIPFFLLAVLFGIVAIYAQQSTGSITTGSGYTLFDNLFIASRNVLFYLYKFLVPIDLSAYYPYPGKTGGTLPLFFFAAPVILLILAGAIWRFYRANRLAVFGAVFFLVTISNVLQLLPVGGAMAADRYTYIPFIGLAILLVVLLKEVTGPVTRNSASKPIVAVVISAAILIPCALLAHARAGIWKDSITLWSDVISSHGDIALPYKMRGLAYRQAAGPDEAREDFSRSLAINPLQQDVLVMRGVVLKESNRFDEALRDYEEAIRIDPSYTLAYNNRGALFLAMKRFDKAISDFAFILKQSPYDVMACYNMGNACLESGDAETSIGYFSRVISANAAHEGAYSNRGTAYLKVGNLPAAINDYGAVIRLTPTDASAYYNRANVYVMSGDYARAIADYDESLRLNPQFTQAQYNRSFALQKQAGK